jgi:hypothetical protein
MANHLTNNVLVNTAALYRFTPAQDQDAAVVGDDSAYPAVLAAGVRCSVQPERPERLTDQERTSGFTVWNVLFRADPGLSVNDRVVWVDGEGVTHRLTVTLARNLAGRGGAWEARCEERT